MGAAASAPGMHSITLNDEGAGVRLVWNENGRPGLRFQPVDANCSSFLIVRQLRAVVFR